MTICLALVCDGGKSIVAVADRMVSVESLALEFEQGTRKIEQIGDRFAALTAGDALAQTDLLRDASEAISKLNNPSVRDVAQAVEECFIRHRNALAEKLVLRRVGLDYAAFLDQQQNLLSELAVRLWSDYQSVELEVELLIVGVDSSGAHLYQISDPGLAVCLDSIGYAAIGSGLPHAEGFLTEADYSPGISLLRGIWLTYLAKRRSERAPGVGSRFTDILVIQDNAIKFMPSTSLEDIYSRYSDSLTGESDKMSKAFNAVEQEIGQSFQESESAEGGEKDG